MAIEYEEDITKVTHKIDLVKNGIYHRTQWGTIYQLISLPTLSSPYYRMKAIGAKDGCPGHAQAGDTIGFDWAAFRNENRLILTQDYDI